MNRHRPRRSTAAEQRGHELLIRDQAVLMPFDGGESVLSATNYNVRRFVVATQTELPQTHPLANVFGAASRHLDRGRGTSILRADQVARATSRLGPRLVHDILEDSSRNWPPFIEATLGDLSILGATDDDETKKSIVYHFDECTEYLLESEIRNLFIALELGTSKMHPPHLTIASTTDPSEAQTILSSLDGNSAEPIRIDLGPVVISPVPAK